MNGNVFARFSILTAMLSFSFLGLSPAKAREGATLYFSGPSVGCSMEESLDFSAKCLPPILAERVKLEPFFIFVVETEPNDWSTGSAFDKAKSAEVCSQDGVYFVPMGSWSPEFRFDRNGMKGFCTLRVGIWDDTKITRSDNLYLSAGSGAGECGLPTPLGPPRTSRLLPAFNTDFTKTPSRPFLEEWTAVNLNLRIDKESVRMSPCEITINTAHFDAAKGDIGIDVAYFSDGDASQCPGAINKGDYYSIAIRPIKDPIQTIASGGLARIVPPPQPQEKVQLYLIPDERAGGCILQFRLVGKPYARYLTGRAALASEALVSIDLQTSVKVKMQSGGSPEEMQKEIERLEKEKKELQRRLDEAREKIEKRQFKDSLKTLWDVGKFVWAYKEGVLGPMILGDLLIDNSNQEPSPLDRAYMRGLKDPTTADLYSMSREELENLAKTYSHAKDVVSNMPMTPQTLQAMQTIDTLLAGINQVIDAQKKGVDVEKLEQTKTNIEILNSKPMDIDPGLIDIFDKNREWIEGQA
jgi:hypothetical protein